MRHIKRWRHVQRAGLVFEHITLPAPAIIRTLNLQLLSFRLHGGEDMEYMTYTVLTGDVRRITQKRGHSVLRDPPVKRRQAGSEN